MLLVWLRMRRKLRRRMQSSFTPKIFRSGCCLFLILAQISMAVRARAAEPEGIALAIVYDTSGSMREAVATADGKRAAKYIIGNRAVEQIVHKIEHFATNAPSPRVVHTGLFVFSGSNAREAVPLGPFKAPALLDWVKRY